jgi:hypothetical protein
MIVIRRESELLKEVITIEEGKERWREHNKYGWSFVDYLYTLKKNIRTHNVELFC